MALPHIDLLYSASGLFVGFLVGLTGVGGGSLMTPILVLLFNVHPATAVGTDLLYAAATKATGTLVHGLKGSVDWQVTPARGRQRARRDHHAAAVAPLRDGHARARAG